MSRLEEAQAEAAGAYADFAAVHAALRARAVAFVARRPPRAVLVVEDDPAFAKLLARIIRQEFAAVSVQTVGTCAAAMDALGLTGRDVALPGVALVDCQLPDGDGWDVANRAPRSVQIILMSGHVDATMLAKLADGVQAQWLKKPIEMDELVELVRDKLEAAEV